MNAKEYFIDLVFIDGNYKFVARDRHSFIILDTEDNLSSLIELHQRMINQGFERQEFIYDYSLDLNVIQQFYKDFNINFYVDIQFSANKGNYGFYRFDISNNYPLHKITIKKWLSPNLANFTLLHELFHAVQVERELKGIRNLDLMKKKYIEGMRIVKEDRYVDRDIEKAANQKALLLLSQFNGIRVNSYC